MEHADSEKAAPDNIGLPGTIFSKPADRYIVTVPQPGTVLTADLTDWKPPPGGEAGRLARILVTSFSVPV